MAVRSSVSRRRLLDGHLSLALQPRDAALYNDDPRVEISAPGRVVQVAVTTNGGGCLSKGNTVTRVSSLQADVTPWDYTAPPGTACTRQLVSVRHTATLLFDRAGEAVIRVHGLDASTANATKLRGDTIVVQRTVRVE
jgi:hypothetical protein